ncbi:MAG: CDP-alcohol phosphatidyltransferase family protein [Ignavibacteriaceae bacterium]
MKMNSKDIFTFSNLLSLIRLFLFLPLWILINKSPDTQVRIIVVSLCMFGALTDILDGYFARRRNEVTEFGKIIDPLADKIVIGALVIKLFTIGEIPGYYLLMIIIRDLLILVGGIIVTRRIGKVLPSNILGKITVINIAIVILFILFDVNKSTLLFEIIYFMSIILIITSLIGYIVRAKEFLNRKENESI